MRAAESTRNAARCHRPNRRPSPTGATGVLILFLAGCAAAGHSELGARTEAPTPLGLDGSATAARQPPQQEADDAALPTGSDQETVSQSTAADAGPDDDANMGRAEADFPSDDAILRALATVRPDAGGGAPPLEGAAALEAAPERVRGRPADVHTKPGRYGGYHVVFGCGPHSLYSVVVVLGLGTVPLPDFGLVPTEVDPEPERQFWRVSKVALKAAGVRSAYGFSGVGPCLTARNHAIGLTLDDFRDVDAAIGNVGAWLVREHYAGEVVLELWPKRRPGDMRPKSHSAP